MRDFAVSLLWLSLWLLVSLVFWVVISFLVMEIFFGHPSMRRGMSCLGCGFGFLFIACGINPFIALGLTGYLYVWVDSRREKPKRKNDFIGTEKPKREQE